ncbi:unnamed protein product [Lasius platythorax]|uniref:HAT C-terminal dimerisation domain-containing protein n=1 Tax=Lasius platythorax TaxID=488582 RepID=A0AAV2MZ32_9HYME
MSNLIIDDGVPKSHVQSFWESCQKFYIELVTQIKKYFDFKEDIFDIISVVDPVIAQQFEIKSLQPVIKRFPILNDYVNSQSLDNEWQEHGLFDYAIFGLDAGKPANEYWKKVFELKNAMGMPLFNHLKKVMQLLLVLPFSNASVERVFSTLKNCKTENRNSMNAETVISCLVTKQGIEDEGDCIKFNPTKKMLQTKTWNK